MKSEDFSKLENFTELEVGETGANFGDVQFSLMETLQSVRNGIGKPIVLIKNGLTTGTHSSKYHPMGLAVDFKFKDFVRPDRAIHAMITAGFRGIGVYQWADGHYTFHGDLRPHSASWFRSVKSDGGLTDESIFRSSFF